MLFSALPASASAVEKREDKVFRVLAIGNSFSDDATSHLYQLAEDAGATEIVLGNLYIGGCSLSTHLNNAKSNKAAYDYRKNTNGSWNTRGSTTMEYGIKDEDWDLITLQQVSGLSGIPDTYNSDLDELADYVLENKTNPEAKLGWHMTWAYQQNSNHGDFPRYKNDQMTMYKAITDTVQQKVASNEKFDVIIPSGTAVQNVRTSYIGDTLTRDGYHLSLNLGRYIAGLTWVKAITGWSIDDVAYTPDFAEVPSEYLPIIKEAVNNAVASPYEVTQSSYTKAPENPDITDEYTKLDIEFGGIGYWNSGDGAYSADPVPNTTAGNSKYFVYTTKRFTKKDIPAGSIIEVDSGYQYRPDGWGYEGKSAPGRPGNVTTERLKIDDSFWTNYEYRTFNIAAVGSNTDLTGKEAETAEKFRIYVPNPDQELKSSGKDITSLSIGESVGTFRGNQITVSLPETEDITALTPDITVSEKASVSPSGPQDFTSPVHYTVTAEDGSTRVYVVCVKLERVYDLSKYDLIDTQVQGIGFWNSNDGGYAADPKPATTGDLAQKFIYTNRFTKEDIPVGSVIVVDPGYQYRPEGWGFEGAAAPGRPGNMTENHFEVTKDWWKEYEYRAFNIAPEGNSVYLNEIVDEVASHFKIYVPKPASDEKDITGFTLNGVSGTIDGQSISVILPFGSDVTKLVPVITVSEGAAVSPEGAQDFTEPVKYTVTAENGTVKEYTVTVTVSQPEFELGDIDRNFSVNVADIMMLKNLIMNGSWDEQQLSLGDMDGNKKLDVSDMISIKAKIMAAV